jgi:hypothetical protein
MALRWIRLKDTSDGRRTMPVGVKLPSTRANRQPFAILKTYKNPMFSGVFGNLLEIFSRGLAVVRGHDYLFASRKRRSC